MTLFDQPEYEYFFNPFCCRNRRIYYDCILQLIEKSKTVPVLYEEDAKDILILYLRNCRYAVEDEDTGAGSDENISNRKSETENASAILRYFRRCGWICERELGRNGDNIATVSPYCRKLVDSIERIFNRDNNAALTNHIFSIYDILHSAFITDHGRTHRPYSNILVPASESIQDLKNELYVLKDSIRGIMRVILQMTETNELGQFLIRDEMLETFFRDYFFIKKDGMIPGYIEEIEKMLREIRSTEVYAGMIREYTALHDVDETRAKDTVDSQLEEIRSFVSYGYGREMDYIDQKINHYYNLYSTRILMVLNGGTNLQAYLDQFLTVLKALDPQDRQEVLEKVSSCFGLQSYRYVGRKSIERRKRRVSNGKNAALPSSELTQEERSRLTRELLKGYPDRYDLKQTAVYYDALLGREDSLELQSGMLRSRDDVMMTAACIIYSGSTEFPFEAELLEGMMETPMASVRRIRIARKK